MGSFCSSDLTAGQLNALVKNVGGHDSVIGILNGTLTLQVTDSAFLLPEQEGVQYFFVTSYGLEKRFWRNSLESRGFKIHGKIESMINSSEFNRTSGAVSKIAILPGSMFTDKERNNNGIFSKATKLNLVEPTLEMACLLREHLADQSISDMGFSKIIVMHNPVKDYDGNLRRLELSQGELGAVYPYIANKSDPYYSADCGFAFLVSVNTN